MIEPLLEAERALTMGLLDRAEQTYRSVVAADPRNSIAVVGLARVALERGADLEALRLGRAALRVDPENVTALRLVARLEEVLEARGEEVPPEEAAAAEPGAAADVASPSGRPVGEAEVAWPSREGAGEAPVASPPHPPAGEPEASPSPSISPLAPTANAAAQRRRGLIGRFLRRGR